MQQALDRLKQATDDMRRAVSPEQSEAEARRAADRLKEAQNLLGGMRQQQTSSRLGSVANEASRLSKEQSAQADRMKQLYGDPGQRPSIDDRRKLADDRQRLAEDLGRLEKEMQDTARELATNKQGAASSKLRDALGEAQQADLQSRIQRGADWIRRGINPNTNGAEQEITPGIQRLEKEVQEAQQAVGDTGTKPGGDSQQGLQTALNRVERLRNQMDSLSRDGKGQGRQPGQQGQGGQQGQQGQQGGGQNGGAGGPGGAYGARIGDGRYGDGTYGGGVRNGGAYGYYGFDTGNNTPLGGRAAPPDNSPIPPQRAYQESLRDLNQLRQEVQQDPEMAREIQDLIHQMERLDPSRFPGNPALVEQLHTQVLATVDKLELQLRRQLDDKQSGQVRSGDTRPVPAGYEDSVAEYYRRLSKSKQAN